MSVVRDSHRMRTEVDILTRVGRSNRQARSFAAKIVGATPAVGSMVDMLARTAQRTKFQRTEGLFRVAFVVPESSHLL